MAELVHTRLGSGPKLLLVHGIGSRKEAWDPVLVELAAHREVIAVDLPHADVGAPRRRCADHPGRLRRPGARRVPTP